MLMCRWDLMMSHCDEDFLKFCQLMIDVGQFRSVQFWTGSRAEVEGNEISMERFSIDDSIDEDLMYYMRDLYVFSKRDDVPSVYRGRLCMYVTDGIHPGYVRLLRESDGSEVVYDNKENMGKYKRCGPAMTEHFELSEAQNLDLTEEQARLYVVKSDFVYARHRPYWPHEAVQWIIRQRPHGSLSHDVIRRVVRYGCDFVNVSHKGYTFIEPDKHNEWRFSFSVAELILIKNWSREQRAMYRTIRVIHKRSLNIRRKSRLCTYHFKTLMLWAVEIEPPCFWNDIVLRDSVRALLLGMIHCLKIKCLHHYFIPTNNLFDHLLSEDLSDDVNALLCICEDTVLILEVLTNCMDEEIFMSFSRKFILMPQMLYNSINIISSTSSYLFNVLVDPFGLSRRNKAKLQNSLSAELKTAYGLRSMSPLEQKNLIPHPKTKCFNWCLNGLQYLVDQEYARNESIAKIFNVNQRFCNIFEEFYPPQMNTSIDYQSWLQNCELAAVEEGTSKMSTSITQMKHVLYCRSERWIFSYDSVILFNSTDNVEHQETDTRGETDEKFLKDLTLTVCEVCPVRTTFRNTASYCQFNCSFSPTVPISWFINKAYTANSYYTLLSDYKTTVEICDETINAYNISERNEEFSEFILPFLLSTQWIEMHDRELQQMLGLAALCRFVIHGPDNRSVHLPSCPVQFALYLKVRCMLDSLDSEGMTSDKLKTASKEYDEHNSARCKDAIFFIYGSASLSAALRIYMRAAVRSMLCAGQ